MNCKELNIEPCPYCRLKLGQCWVEWFANEIIRDPSRNNIIKWMKISAVNSSDTNVQMYLGEALKEYPEMYEMYLKLLLLL
jgi:hypothetical protein